MIEIGLSDFFMVVEFALAHIQDALKLFFLIFQGKKIRWKIVLFVYFEATTKA